MAATIGEPQRLLAVTREGCDGSQGEPAQSGERILGGRVVSQALACAAKRLSASTFHTRCAPPFWRRTMLVVTFTTG